MMVRDESLIMKKWSGNSPLVSIQCLVFNHAPFIAGALDSFLMQETNFPFEIIVHDDASTDGSAEIIRKYEKKFPRIVKAIYEVENQYSKKNGSLTRIMNSACKGRFWAFCEGDDYWTDVNKLQKQVDFLISHMDYVACAHNTFVVEVEDSKRNRVMYPLKDVVLSIENLKDRYHASSLMFRKEAFLGMPVFFNFSLAPGDVKVATWLKYKGPIFRFGAVMSAYRHGVPGSWTKHHVQNYGGKFKNAENVIEFYKKFNVWSGYKFESITQRIAQLSFEVLLGKGLLADAKRIYPQLYHNLTRKEKLRYFFIAHLPKLYRLNIFLKNLIR